MYALCDKQCRVWFCIVSYLKPAGTVFNIHTLLQTLNRVFLALKHLQNVSLVVLVTTGDLRDQEEDLWRWAQCSWVNLKWKHVLEPMVDSTRTACSMIPVWKAEESCARSAWVQQVYYYCQPCTTRKQMLQKWPLFLWSNVWANAYSSAHPGLASMACIACSPDGPAMGNSEIPL